MFCPNCGTEYREGFTQCADCHIPLTAQLPPTSQQEQFPSLVGVLDTNDNFALGMATHALDRAGIIYDVVEISDAPANLKTPEPKWWIPPSRVLVSTNDAEEARSLVEPYRERLPGDF